jgi:hypothetical protein
MVGLLSARVATEDAAAACTVHASPATMDASEAAQLLEARRHAVCSSLWERGVALHGNDDIVGAVGCFERTSAILEDTGMKVSTTRCFATLAHLYWRQARINDAIDVANRCLTLVGSTASSEDTRDSQSLARIVLIKCMVHTDDAHGVQTQVQAFLDASLSTTATIELESVAVVARPFPSISPHGLTTLKAASLSSRWFSSLRLASPRFPSMGVEPSALSCSRL